MSDLENTFVNKPPKTKFLSTNGDDQSGVIDAIGNYSGLTGHFFNIQGRYEW